jgi:hypothetical protein
MRISATLLFLPVLAHTHSLTAPSSSQSTLATSIASISTEPSASSVQKVWVPVQTILNPSTDSNGPSPTTLPEHELELREIVAAVPPTVLPGGVTQLSPVTTMFEQHWENGIPTPVQIIYSQSFAAVPDQLPGPMSGSIGLGNINGRIGVVKTQHVARAATPVPEAEKLRPRSGTETNAKASGAMLALVVVAAVGTMLL